MLPEEPTAGTGADGDRAAGLTLKFPMHVRRRAARRTWLPAEPEKMLQGGLDPNKSTHSGVKFRYLARVL